MEIRRATAPDAAASGTYRLAGELPVHRLGYGAMRLTGTGIWGPPSDHGEAIRVLRRAVELGVTLIDTADAYGPHVSEELIADALHPYPAGLVIATKGGLVRPGPGQWEADGRPERLRAACEGSLRRLRLERIDLYQLHRVDPKVPAEDQFGTLAALQREGKIRLLGLSEVDVGQIRIAQRSFAVAAVQNRYNVEDREWESVVGFCTDENIAFLPWFPLRTGTIGGQHQLQAVARRLHATPMQVALAWLLARSPVMLPIPGTASVRHLEENLRAGALELFPDDLEALDGAGH